MCGGHNEGFSLGSRQAPPKGQAGRTESLAPRPESWAGNHGLDGVPTAAPPGAAGNDTARLEQGAWGAPKLQQCASERWGGPSLPGRGARCPQLQQYASERQPPAPTPWTGLREIWGKTVRGLLGPQVVTDPRRPEGDWSPPLRAGRLAAGPPLTAFQKRSLRGWEKGSSQDSLRPGE